MRCLKLVLFFFSSLLLLQACLEVQESYAGPAPGVWRAVLQLEPEFISHNKKGEPLPEKVDYKFEDVNENQLPFLFEVIYANNDQFHIEIINGEERIKIEDINVGIDRKTARDTIDINFKIYESTIRAVYRAGIMQGEWIVHSKDNYRIPFIAKHGKTERFTVQKKTPIDDLSGNWKVTFDADKEEPYMAIGEFKQRGNQLSGTFRTETGDYRFLDGTIQNDRMYLSCFDGSHAFLFEAQMDKNKKLRGQFRSGKHYKSYWEAERDADFQLVSPDSLTFLKEGFDKIRFSFPNSDGKMVSLEDSEYDNKVKIIQILGTWCPNCRDETSFLVDYLKKNKAPNLEVIALAFEKYKTLEEATPALLSYKDKFNMPYELLYAGYYKKSEAVESLPMLNKIISYPTMIFIDKNDQVRRIHTGFSGPATSQYEIFENDFKSYLDNLLNE